MQSLNPLLPLLPFGDHVDDDGDDGGPDYLDEADNSVTGAEFNADDKHYYIV